jgi:hypothetical protein
LHRCSTAATLGTGRGMDQRHDVTDKSPQRFIGRIVPQPEDEFAAACVNESLHLHRDLLGCADEMVASILGRRCVATQWAAVRVFAPPVGFGVGVKDAAIRPVGAGDLLERSTYLIAVEPE